MTTAYRSLSPEALRREYAEVSARFDALRELGLALNMARGKPGKAQLDAVSDILTILHDPVQCQADGMDVRNYGQLSGLPSAKKLFAELLGCRAEECFIGGSASLTLMYDTIAKAYTHGLLHSEAPWSRLDKVKWLCPAPGYDRHFKITESFGAEMITVPMTPTGPDMDLVEAVRAASSEGRPLACVLCDESQFLTAEQAEQLFMVTVELNIPVICYGLRSDFSLKGFPGSTRLLELAHTIEEMKTICTCGRKATCNCRKVNGRFVFEGEQVAIDLENDVQYVSMCPQCYFRERSAFYAARR